MTKTNTPFKSKKAGKKYSVYAYDGKTTRLVHFGANGYEDYTIHKDEERRRRYIARHEKNENWDKSGIFTPGFWSVWVLWNKPSFKSSVKDVQEHFNLEVKSLR